MENQNPIESVTFSSTSKQDKDGVVNCENENEGAVALSFKEYCERNPSALECKEFDV